MDVFVPFDALDPKRRLAPVLSEVERSAFAEAMLADVIDAIESTGRTPQVLSNAPMDVPWAVFIDERPLTSAVNSLLDLSEGPMAIIMADLALATPEAIDRLLSEDGDVVLVPGVGGGTNALVVRDRSFSVDFHGCSIADHREIAASADLATSSVDSFSLSIDIDEPSDLAEVLLHSDGAAADWLADNGFAVVEDDEQRVRVERTPED